MLATLACSTDGLTSFVVTLTPTGEASIMEDMTQTSSPMPTVIYPTLTPVPTDTPEFSYMFCDPESTSIVCRATVCVVRSAPASGEGNRAYTVPNGAVIEDVLVCECSVCAPFEEEWFYLGRSGGQDYWALKMDLVWEVYQGE